MKNHRKRKSCITVSLGQNIAAHSSSLLGQDDSDGNNSNVILLMVHPRRSRLVWNILKPILFEEDSSSGIALQLLRAILGCLEKNKYITDITEEDSTKTEHENSHDNNGILSRRFEWNDYTQKRRQQVLFLSLWIQPPPVTLLEHSFESRLLGWEHQLLQAQSVAGYLSTLGGAFFMCHHFDTATKLAQRQCQMALLLNDSSMYYKCLLYQAYNAISNAHFDAATSLIRCVQRECESRHTVILAMCESALLFCHRVRQMANVVMANKSNKKQQEQESMVVDDLARIRLFKDESRSEDMIRPFQQYN